MDVEFVFGNSVNAMEVKKKVADFLSDGYKVVASGGTAASFWICFAKPKG